MESPVPPSPKLETPASSQRPSDADSSVPLPQPTSPERGPQNPPLLSSSPAAVPGEQSTQGRSKGAMWGRGREEGSAHGERRARWRERVSRAGKGLCFNRQDDEVGGMPRSDDGTRAKLYTEADTKMRAEESGELEALGLLVEETRTRMARTSKKLRRRFWGASSVKGGRGGRGKGWNGSSAAGQRGEKDGRPTQRFTLSEAAEEIKRLRRLARQNKQDLQKKDEERVALEGAISGLQMQIKKLNREVDAAENKTREKEREINDLKTEVQTLNSHLDEAVEDLRVLQATSLPLNEARKLTYKALRKGRALECLGELFCRNTVTNKMVREGFNALVENALGVQHLAYRAEHGVGPGVHAAVDAQLRLFRQEQLLLLAENERLATELKEVQGSLLKRHMSLELLADASAEEGGPPSPSQAEEKTDGGVSDQEKAIITKKDSKLEKTPSKQRKLRRTIVSASAHLVHAIVKQAQARLLHWGLRKLACYAAHETNTLIARVALENEKAKLNNVRIVLGAKLLRVCIQASVRKREEEGFYRLLVNSAFKSEQKPPEEVSTLVRNPFHAFPLYPPPPGAHPMPGAGPVLAQDPYVNLPADAGSPGQLPPFVCQPYYYGRLPSAQTQRRGNVYFAAPPPASAGQTELKLQALRRTAGVEPVYRPRPELSTLGTPVPDPAGSREKFFSGLPGADPKTEARHRRAELRGALLVPSAAPDDTRLTAAQMNDMYIDMLLDEVDQRNRN
ncbi:hypothetical protein BESB_007910 [Besnoitia besnoiti]|uniref:Uncharacterized protein n=1 Tax=Besnoitia besnoiti TaxID=94643 RepID=A0A2A9MKI6_BESBE|nr:hypothetical protein BESB_007910 [Besnoitia besnoiti]PFH38449.1 hypothetical protein BESB_007910 [Besnoitia besnoiti]